MRPSQNTHVTPHTQYPGDHPPVMLVIITKLRHPALCAMSLCVFNKDPLFIGYWISVIMYIYFLAER